MGERLRATARQVVTLAPVSAPWPAALRAGVGLLVPLLAVVLTGHTTWAAYASAGAFTALYGRNHVHLPRAVMQASAGGVLVLSVLAGVAVGCLPDRAPAAVVVAAAVAALGSTVSRAQDWHPPGTLFPVLSFGVVSSVPHTPADLPVALAVAVGSALFSWAVGNAYGLVRHAGDGRPPQLRHVAVTEPLAVAAAVLLAGAAATAAGIGHPYWAVAAAAAPLSAAATAHQVTRATQRVLGTLLGLLPAAALLALRPAPLAAVVLIAALQVVTELLVGRNYALALLCITPLALLTGQVAAPHPVPQLLADRALETVLGAAAGLVVILAVRALRRGPAPAAG
jgi:hypothetical protein